MAHNNPMPETFFFNYGDSSVDIAGSYNKNGGEVTNLNTDTVFGKYKPR